MAQCPVLFAHHRPQELTRQPCLACLRSTATQHWYRCWQALHQRVHVTCAVVCHLSVECCTPMSLCLYWSLSLGPQACLGVCTSSGPLCRALLSSKVWMSSRPSFILSTLATGSQGLTSAISEEVPRQMCRAGTPVSAPEFLPGSLSPHLLYSKLAQPLRALTGLRHAQRDRRTSLRPSRHPPSSRPALEAPQGK